MILLLCDGEAVGPSRFLYDPYDFRETELFVASACLLGRVSGSRGYGDMARSFNSTLALRGCRRVTSALWEVDDEVGRVFAEGYMAAILNHAFGEQRDGHSYARAYVDALRNIRKHGEGEFEHEYLWAPYSYYGLG